MPDYLINIIQKCPVLKSQRDSSAIRVTMNPELGAFDDHLYHLGIEVKRDSIADIEKRFGDVKFICMGGTNSRMKELAENVRSAMPSLEEGELVDLCATAKRYAVYKVGPVLCCSHGLGMSSFSVLLHEIIKLVWYAKCKDAVFIRVGTCGGLGLKPGTVVITKDAYNGYLRNEHEIAILGERVVRPARFDALLIKELLSCASAADDFETVIANTLAAECFYEGQARLDGAVCNYSEQDKMDFLQRCYEVGIRNIEMEATMFAALTLQAGVRAADVCVTLINRLEGDQVTTKSKQPFEVRPQDIVIRYIRKVLKL